MLYGGKRKNVVKRRCFHTVFNFEALVRDDFGQAYFVFGRSQEESFWTEILGNLNQASTHLYGFGFAGRGVYCDWKIGGERNKTYAAVGTYVKHAMKNIGLF